MKGEMPDDSVLWEAAFRGGPPFTHHASAQRTSSDEDVVFIEEVRLEEGLTWKLYCVCDGHGGSEAAQHVERHLWASLKERLPKKRPEQTHGFASWARDIRHAVRHAFSEIDDDFAEQFDETCDAGSTVTVALLCDWFLTVANLGDSEAVIDLGTSYEVMTHSHRLEECERERKRLTKAGVHLARLNRSLEGPAENEGFGPQRCWPGGLANSRSIGDLSAGEHIVSSPYIKQCVLPERGCRLIMGSDGLWDVVNHKTACCLTRHNGNKSAPDRLVTSVIYRNDWNVVDDTTVLVVDVLPDESQEFNAICKALRKQGTRKGAVFACFCGSQVKEADPVEKETTTRLIPVAEVDCAEGLQVSLSVATDEPIGAAVTDRSSSIGSQ